MLDTSVLINLGATKLASPILRALPFRLLITDVVRSEFQRGIELAHRSARSCADIVESVDVTLVQLSESALQLMGDLTMGRAVMTLDDGEASSIAYAVSEGAAVAIDDGKACRMCDRLVPPLTTFSSVDLLLRSEVATAIGAAAVSDAVFLALVDARMRVPNHHCDTVVGLIGAHRARQCPSLPRAFRKK